MAEGEKAGEKRFLLLYGSQTGQAKAIAERILDFAVERGLEPDIHCISQSEKEFDLTKEPVVVVVVSTTGEGEAPDTVSKFWRKLRKKTVPKDHLSRVQYGLLGLGDTNYTNFCNMGKNLHRRLVELGATPFVQPDWADDGLGLEIVVEPWIEDLWEPLENILEQTHTEQPHTNSPPPSPLISLHSQSDNPTSVEDTSGPMVVLETSETDSSTVTMPLSSGEPRSVASDREDDKTAKKETNDQRTQQEVLVPAAKITEPAVLVNSEITEAAVSEITEPAVSVNSEITEAAVSVNSENTESAVSEITEVTDSSTFVIDRSVLDIASSLKGVKIGPDPLSLPTIPMATLTVKLCTEKLLNGAEFGYRDIESVYSQAGGVVMATVVGCRQLTNEGALRKTIELEFQVQGEFSYAPGDAVSFICPNPAHEVDLLLQRLDLMSCADQMMQLELSTPQTSNSKTSNLPRHIPKSCSIRQYFTHCADFRAIPKKVMLAYLSGCCGDEEDGMKLAALSSRECSSQYREVILARHVDLVDLLFTFPSCQPSLERLIQFLPRLKPRLYSIASSPLTSPHRLRIALSIISLPPPSWHTHTHLTPSPSDDITPAHDEKRKGLASGDPNFYRVPLAPRGVSNFRLLADPSVPLIMIGPGTGVVPFLGFLEHRREQRQKGGVVGRVWLFFGCRHPDLDRIYDDEMREFVRDGTLTKLTVCFSRLEEGRSGEGEGRYVQDGMRKYATELTQWVMEDTACVYVCGEAKGMARDVEDTWTAILSDKKIVRDLKENRRYLVDAWTS